MPTIDVRTILTFGITLLNLLAAQTKTVLDDEAVKLLERIKESDILIDFLQSFFEEDRPSNKAENLITAFAKASDEQRADVAGLLAACDGCGDATHVRFGANASKGANTHAEVAAELKARGIPLLLLLRLLPLILSLLAVDK